MSIKIRDVKVILTAPEGINLTVVKVETSEPGLYGLGCATFAYRHLAVKCLLEEYIKPLLIGLDVEKIEENWRLMHQNAYWRNGPIENNAIAGIDLALWDIKGKLAKMPLYQLFGGKYREGVPVYRHVDGRDAAEICDNIQKYTEMGVRYLRCQCGGYGGDAYGKAPASAPENSPKGIYLEPKKYMRETIKLFEAIRKNAGDEIDLCHDVHERLPLSDAVYFAKAMEQFHLLFLEDAIPLEHLEWLRDLRTKTITPLSIGELFNNPAEWKTIIAERLIDYIRVHVTQIGGITAARKLQIFAEQYGVRIAWHGPGDMSPLAHAANIHIDIAAPNMGVQEWSGIEPPNFVIQELNGKKGALLEVFPSLPECRNGYVYANDKPGLGVDINEKEAEKYPCKNTVTTWTQTRFPDGSFSAP
jgi:mannonate dehydratase